MTAATICAVDIDTYLGCHVPLLGSNSLPYSNQDIDAACPKTCKEETCRLGRMKAALLREDWSRGDGVPPSWMGSLSRPYRAEAFHLPTSQGRICIASDYFEAPAVFRLVT